MFGAILTGWPGAPLCCLPTSGPFEGPLVFELERFTPYIVEQHDYGWPVRRGPQCPGPHAVEGAFGLAEAPLPSSYDPAAWPEERLFACIRLSEEGEVLDVALRGIRGPILRTTLTDMIRDEWRFSPTYFEESTPRWIKVRLNIGPYDPPAMPAFRLN